MALMQGFMAGLQGVHRAALGVVGDEPLLGDGVLVGSERRVELHVCAYDLQENVQLQNRQLKKTAHCDPTARRFFSTVQFKQGSY